MSLSWLLDATNFMTWSADSAGRARLGYRGRCRPCSCGERSFRVVATTLFCDVHSTTRDSRALYGLALAAPVHERRHDVFREALVVVGRVVGVRGETQVAGVAPVGDLSLETECVGNALA